RWLAAASGPQSEFAVCAATGWWRTLSRKRRKTEAMEEIMSAPPGVFAVQCPNPRCRKYMLVEESDRNKVVPCLLCKTPIRVGGMPRANAPRGRNGREQ